MEEIVGKVAINSNVEDVRGDYSGLEKRGQKGSGGSSRSVRDANSMSNVVNRSVDRGAVRDGGDASKVKKKEKLSKKCTVNSPEFHMRNSLGIAAMGVVRLAKTGSGSRSLDTVHPQKLDIGEEEDGDIDDEARDRKDQTQKLEVNEIRVSDDVTKYARKKGFEIYERMCLDKVQMNEAALTSVARMAMGVGDAVTETRLLICNGDIEKAFAVEKHMLENGVYPEEPELEALLRVNVEAGKADRVYYVLHKLRTVVRFVSPSTADLIENRYWIGVITDTGSNSYSSQQVKALSATCSKQETDIVVLLSHRDLRNTLSESTSSKLDHLPFLNAIKAAENHAGCVIDFQI
uniref:PROP1-like PPR domain-containing protein n=1 Tax=Chenopodium quinoa TaxID=63459 RepID=A0A803L6E0_CHEQI